MAPKQSSKRSKSTRNGTASMNLKKRRRSMLWKSAIQKMVRKEVKKQVSKILHAVNSLAGNFDSTSGPLVSQVESSRQRRLQLYFVYKMPSKLYTSDIVYPIADDAEANVPVSVVLRDENNVVVNEGPLSSLKVEISVACGDYRAEEGKQFKTSLLRAREKLGSLLVGSRIKTMENGVCFFNDLKFLDNSSWVRSKMFRLVAKVEESAQVSGMVEIREAVSEPFRVKDQRGKAHQNHPIPLWNDEVRRLEKVGIKNNKKLEAAGIRIVRDFLQNYNKDQSLLREVLGVKDGVWKIIVQHAKKCSPNGEHFRYDSEEGVELLFDCFYKLIGVSFDHQNHQSLETLSDYHKGCVEHLRQRAFNDESKLIKINFPVGWPSANINPCITPYPNPQNPLALAHQDELAQDNEILVVDEPMQDKEVLAADEQVQDKEVLSNVSSYPQSSLLVEILHHQEEEPEGHSISGMEYMKFLRSNSLLVDSLIMDYENHPLSMPNLATTANHMFHGQSSSCSPIVVREVGHVWFRARVAVRRFLNASRSNNSRMLTAGS